MEIGDPVFYNLVIYRMNFSSYELKFDATLESVGNEVQIR